MKNKFWVWFSKFEYYFLLIKFYQFIVEIIKYPLILNIINKLIFNKYFFNGIGLVKLTCKLINEPS